MKTLAIFAHYDVENVIKNYVVYYIQKLLDVADEIIFVSTSLLPDSEKTKINQLVNKVIIRENIGYDFYSYKIGLESLEGIEGVKELILCNDSCFGPLFSFTDSFNHMRSQALDFWGISSTSRPEYHMQSYFLVFNEFVIKSLEFKAFWDELQILSNKDEIVFNYEVGLSQNLINAGFKCDSLIPNLPKISFYQLFKRKLYIIFKELGNRKSRYSFKLIFNSLARLDKAIVLYDFMVSNYQMPLIKKSLLNDFWVNKEGYYKLVKDNTNYPVKYIRDAINKKFL